MQSRPAAAALSSRRAFLRRALGLAAVGPFGVGVLGSLAGCDVFGGRKVDPPPDNLDGFIRATAALGDRYDAAIRAVPALSESLVPIRDAHRAHTRALVDATGVSPTPPAASAAAVRAGRDQALAALATAETEARDEAVNACMSASARMAPLLGTIAAARAAHLEVIT
jgi:hypothetical protein